jgi:hypothetical protein
MMISLLGWLDRRVFVHRWEWLCNLAWDRQLARDGELLARLWIDQ